MSPTLAPTSARCLVPGCVAKIPLGRRLCVDCWTAVPWDLRRAVWAAYRAKTEELGYQLNDAAYEAAYLAAVQAAVASVARA